MRLFDLASRYIGIKELKGTNNNHPLIQWWISLCGFDTTQPDETPWCSAFINGMCWELRLPRSKSAAAKSWLKVGSVITLHEATLGDIIILNRGTNPAQGHVGLFAGHNDINVTLLAGNQGDAVCLEDFPISSIAGVRRISG